MSTVTEFNLLPDGTIALVLLGSTLQRGYGYSANKSAAFSIKTVYLMLTFQVTTLVGHLYYQAFDRICIAVLILSNADPQ